LTDEVLLWLRFRSWSQDENENERDELARGPQAAAALGLALGGLGSFARG